jgi:hypothetical protein
MATVVEQLRQRPFYLPPLQKDGEPCARALDDLQVNFVGLFQAMDPVLQPLRLITAIDPALPQPFHSRSTIPLQQLHQALPIVDIGGGDHDGDDQPEGIDQNMALPSLDLFVAVKAHVLALRRGFDTLALGTPGRRFRQPPLAVAFPVAQGLHDVPLLPVAPVTRIECVIGHSLLPLLQTPRLRQKEISKTPTYPLVIA